MGYLDRYAIKNIVLDISEDANTSQIIDIQGYELIGIITPAALDGVTNDITPQIDPGNGTFYTPLTNAGAAITWWENVAADEWLQVPQSTSKIVGARLRLEFSETEDADRTFLAVLVALTGSSN